MARLRAWLPTSGQELAAAVPALVLLVLFDAAVAASGLLVARLFAAAFLLVVPGAVLCARTRLQPGDLAVRVAWSVGASLLVVMLLGLLESAVLPPLGVAEPLRAVPLAIGIDVVVLAGALVDRRHRDPLAFLLAGKVPTVRQLAVATGAAAFPLLAAAGAERVNGGAGGGLALAALVATGAAFAVLVALARRAPAWFVTYALYLVSLAAILTISMRSDYPFGYDIQSEYQVFLQTAQAGAWHLPVHGDPYAAMLSITVLPASMAALAHLSGPYVFKTMYSFVFALFPVLAYVVARRFFPRRTALVGPVLIICQGLYAADITGLARQEIGLLFFGLLVVTFVDTSQPRRVRQVAAVTAFIGMSISHYSTAYFAATTVVFGYAGYGLLRLLRRKPRPAAVLSLPVVVLGAGSMLLWNAVITRSAGNVTAFAAAIADRGLQLLPSNGGGSLIQRFLKADLGSISVSPHRFVAMANASYARTYPWVHTFPASVTSRYPPVPATVARVHAPLSPSLQSAVTTFKSVSDTLILAATVLGVLLLLWRERRIASPERAELAMVALGTVALLGLLRTSGTISTYYNASRGQVQGAVVLSVGLAAILTALFERRRAIAAALAGIGGLFLAAVLYSSSGLFDYVVAGDGVAELTNAGVSYQLFYISPAEMATAGWLVHHEPHGAVTYADTYGALRLDELRRPHTTLQVLLPSVLDKKAFVYATRTNVVDHIARAEVGKASLTYVFPSAFLHRVKDVVFATSTTRVYR